MPTYYCDQQGYAILAESNRGSPTAEDGDWTDRAASGDFILAYQTNENGCNKATDACTHAVQYDKDGDDSWVTITDSTEIAWVTSVTLTDGSDTANVLTSTLPNGCDTLSSNCRENEGDNTIAVPATASGTAVEVQVALNLDNAVASVAYRLRIINVSGGNTPLVGSPLGSTITIAAPPADVNIGTGGTLFDSVSVNDDTVDLAQELVPNVYDEVTVDDDTISFAQELVPSVFDAVDVDAELGVTVQVLDSGMNISVYDDILCVEGYQNIQVLLYDYHEYWEGGGSGLQTHYLNARSLIPAAVMGNPPGNANKVRLSGESVGYGSCAVFDNCTIGMWDDNDADYVPGTITQVTFNGGETTFHEDTPIFIQTDWIRFKHWEAGGTLVVHNWKDTYSPWQSMCRIWQGGGSAYYEGSSTVHFPDNAWVEQLDITDLTYASPAIFDFHIFEFGTGSKLVLYHPTIVFIDEQEANDHILVREDVTMFFETMYISGTYNAVTVDEDVTVDVEVLDADISVFDEVTVEEDTTELVYTEILEVSVYDEVTVEESVTFTFASSVNVYDEVSVDEYTAFEFISYVSVFDSVGTEEYSDLAFELVPNVFDSVSVDEYTDEVLELFHVSVYDEVSVAEADYTPQLGSAGDRDINVYSSITVEENITASLPDDLEVDLYDAVTVADKTPTYQALYDTKVVVYVDVGMSIYDAVSLDEYVLLELSDIAINIYDEISVTEDVQEIVESEGEYNVSVYDEVTLQESTSFEFISYISVFDSVSTDKFNDLAFELVINTYDAVTIDEYVLLAPELVASVYDSITVDEYTNQYFDFRFISVYDEITVTEYFPVIVEEVGELYSSVYDSVTVDEYIENYILVESVVYDEIVIDEYVAASLSDLGVEVYDSVTVDEYVDISAVIDISTYDEVTVEENIDLAFELVANVYDTVTVEDSGNADVGDLSVNVYDSVSVEEWLITDEDDMIISVYDSITVDEDVTLSISVATQFDLFEYEEVSISESVTLAISDLSIDVFDSVTVDEYADASGIYIYITGSVAIIDDIVLVTGDISLEESLAKTEVNVTMPTISVELL